MNFNQQSHRRKNILTGEWVLVSPNRTKRPWQGKKEIKTKIKSINYDPDCYLCPGNLRVNNEKNPAYSDTYSFTNDFSALLDSIENNFKEGLLEAHSESGICKVLCYSPNHSPNCCSPNRCIEIRNWIRFHHTMKLIKKLIFLSRFLLPIWVFLE